MAFETEGERQAGKDLLNKSSAGLQEVAAAGTNLGGLWDQPIEILKLKENEFVFRENESPKGLYLLKSGCVKTVAHRSSPRGRMASPEFVQKLVVPGELFGFESLIEAKPTAYSAKAVRASEVFIYPREAVTSILTGPNPLLRTLLLQTAREVTEQQALAQRHYLASVQERIADQLVLLADRFGVKTATGDVDISLRLSRNELAQLAGTINESLSRHLTDLKTEGIIELHGKEIRIKNLEELRKRAGQ